MLARLYNFLRSLFSPAPVRLAIVRRYADANGNYVGELYMDKTVHRKHDSISAYLMIGASLDSFNLDVEGFAGTTTKFDNWLDTKHDFLDRMPPNTLRVGALDPKDNDEVRRLIAKLPRRRMTLAIQNRFIEHVMERRPC